MKRKQVVILGCVVILIVLAIASTQVGALGKFPLRLLQTFPTPSVAEYAFQVNLGLGPEPGGPADFYYQPMIMEGAGQDLLHEWDAFVGNGAGAQPLTVYSVPGSMAASFSRVGCLYQGASGSYKVRIGFYDESTAQNKYWVEMQCVAGVYNSIDLDTILDQYDVLMAWAWYIPSGQTLTISAFGTNFKVMRSPNP